MADIAVERARAARLGSSRQRDSFNSRKASLATNSGSEEYLAEQAAWRKPPSFARPFIQPQNARELEQVDEQHQAARELAMQQNAARQQQIQQEAAEQKMQALQVGQVVNAVKSQQEQTKAQTANTAKKTKMRQADAAKEKAKRLVVRNTQRTLFTGATAGAETVVATIFLGGIWTTWKTVEFYRTVTGSDAGPFKMVTSKMNFVELLTYIGGLAALTFIMLVIIMLIGLVVWAVNNTGEAAIKFPQLIPYLIKGISI